MMKERLLIILLINCCVVLSCNKDIDTIDSEVVAPDTELLNTGLVTGQVYDEFNKPITDFMIELYVNGQMLDQVQSNDQGEYEIEVPLIKDQDTRLFAYGNSKREILRRITDFTGTKMIDFPVITIQDDEVPSLTPENPDMVVVSGYYKDRNGNTTEGYVRLHNDTQQSDVDVKVRPDRSGYYELFVPKEKALILEMVERCAEEEAMVQDIGPLYEDKVLEELTSQYTYDDAETYKVLGNVLSCQGESMNQYQIVTFTLNEDGVDPLLLSSDIFYYPCQIPAEPYNYFIRDRESKMKSEIRTIAYENQVINYGDVQLCEPDVKMVSIVYQGQRSDFYDDEVRTVFTPQYVGIGGLSPNVDNEINKIEIDIDVKNGVSIIKKLIGYDINSEAVVSLENVKIPFDKADFCFNGNGTDCVKSSKSFFDGGIQNDNTEISVSVYVYEKE